MKNYIVLIISLTIISLTVISCNEEELNSTLDVGLEFSIVNSNGEDILNPSHPDCIKESDIKLYYLIDGIKKEVYNPNYDFPRNFRIYEHQNEFRIGIFQNHSENEDKPLTYIQWNESETDTIEAAYYRSSNAIIQKKIWLNGDLIWESINGTNPYFILTK